MLYEVSADKRHPVDWRVEATDMEGEFDPGTCFVAIFTGSLAEERAREYAAIKTGQGHTSLARLLQLSPA